MGLYAIPIRDDEAAAEIPAVLRSHGYAVFFEREDASARYYVCEGGRRPLHFWITMGTPRRFSIGAGRRGRGVVDVLSRHGVFAEDGGAGAGPQ
ncbi:MAG TPA: hypothetical protein VEA69_18835 [Tepidisphaeraceae bacterium]|nr:hypothetical protein [Tepidisphaeraceae bacterium]